MTAPDPSDDFSVELNDEWAAQAKRREAPADERAQRYAAINQAHQHAQPPRSWTPASSSSSSSSQTWIKVTAIVLIAIAVLAVLSLLRSLG